MITILECLKSAMEHQASDILLIAGLPVSYKISGTITRFGDLLSSKDIALLVEETYQLGSRDMTRFLQTGDDDFSFGVRGLARFRVNVFRQRGSMSLVVRVVSFDLPDSDKLGIPEQVLQFADYARGLILFTGAAGSGKTTTLACCVDRINTRRNAHVITIEDPLEYLHQHKMSVVSQRELAIDTASYHSALRAALREAPNVILVGEMRDMETIQAAITAAETGHLVLSTLHTIGAANTVDRIIDAFPSTQQHQIRTQLSLVLEGVVSQVLIPGSDGRQVPAFEVMRSNHAVRTMIRESKPHQLGNLISTGGDQGMITMDQSILRLFEEKKISRQEALRHSNNMDWMEAQLALIQ